MTHMKITVPVLMTIILLLVTGCSGGTKVANGTDFAGRWLGSAEKTGSSNPTIRLEISTEGDRIDGNISTLDGTFKEVPLSDAVIEAGTLSFRAVANGETQFKDHLYLFSFRRQGGDLVGTWTDLLEGIEGPVSLSLEKP